MLVFPRLILTGVFLVVFAYNSPALAQKETQKFTSKNVVFVELGGNAGRYSINYGHLIFQKGPLKGYGNVGISLFQEPIGSTNYWYPVLPLELTTLLGKRSHHLELGVGITPFLVSQVNSTFETGTLTQTKGPNYLSALLPLRIGYRYQKPEGGFFFRAGYTPFFKLSDRERENWTFDPIFAGIGLGWSF